MLDRGLVQIYTGCGKGKTTAAFGLALRAAGHGGKVLVYQFLKPASLDLGERKAAGGIDGITVELLPESWDMRTSFDDKEAVAKVQSAISSALGELAKTASQKTYDVIILDEIVFCLNKGLARLEDITKVIDERNPSVEIVMTGREATEELIALADLVTEMKPIKHPFDKGIKARKGIEF
ncbi:MAG: cob(I)yrinic acid a,c-diamide adenosyltransferase [Planctomycetota bacterium]|nr:MAG: cob(I)yrinic acid a,c-diamide adenosyltransferase [Planctomycetota bacterium]